MTNQIRVRWAPSNTGPGGLHVGNLRTILFNYLFAKKNGGTTVFRIEDSDLARSKPEYADTIARQLDEMGLRADEGYKIGGDFGPYTQQEKLDRYAKVVNELIERGEAYRCYCTATEMEALRNQLPEKERDRFRYPGICRDRKEWPTGKDYVVRLKAPIEGTIEIDDLVFGKIVVPNKENFDWVLMRSNGVPLYNAGCAIDDHDQKISHVIRGRDHIGNTPQQIILHRLLGSQEIKFAHLPMMLGADGAKLSKRHGSCSVSEFLDAGYSPHAIMNYLSRFGWGSGNREIFSLPDLVEAFTLESCGRNDGKFDAAKFAAINHAHLKSEVLVPDDQYLKLIDPFLVKRGLTNLDPTYVKSLIPLIRPRAKTFIEAAAELDPFLRANITIDEAARDKFLTDAIRPKLAEFSTFLSAIDTWDTTSITEKSNAWLTEHNTTIKEMGQPLRVALTGRSQSPELFQTMTALGKATTIERLKSQAQ